MGDFCVKIRQFKVTVDVIEAVGLERKVTGVDVYPTNSKSDSVFSKVQFDDFVLHIWWKFVEVHGTGFCEGASKPEHFLEHFSIIQTNHCR